MEFKSIQSRIRVAAQQIRPFWLSVMSVCVFLLKTLISLIWMVNI